MRPRRGGRPSELVAAAAVEGRGCCPPRCLAVAPAARAPQRFMLCHGEHASPQRVDDVQRSNTGRGAAPALSAGRRRGGAGHACMTELRRQT